MLQPRETMGGKDRLFCGLTMTSVLHVPCLGAGWFGVTASLAPEAPSNWAARVSFHWGENPGRSREEPGRVLSTPPTTAEVHC